MTESNVMSDGELRLALSAFPTRTMGALVYPGFHALSLWGPLDMFGSLSPAVSVLLIGSRDGPVASANGPAALADVAMGESPRLDLLLIPGGERSEEIGSAETLDWLRWRAADAEIVMAVGTGVGLVAGAGLLDGRRATASPDDLSSLVAAHARVRWVTGARWIDDGKFVTSSGGLVGVDMALAVIGRLTGQRVAATLADRSGYSWIRLPGSPGAHRPDELR